MMSEDIGYYAIIESKHSTVENIIVADDNFSLEGYDVIRYDKENVFCQPGMFYNDADGLFYDDEKFTIINGSL